MVDMDKINNVLELKNNVRKYAITAAHPSYGIYWNEYRKLNYSETQLLKTLDPIPLDLEQS